jgi:hypothetical protein
MNEYSVREESRILSNSRVEANSDNSCVNNNIFMQPGTRLVAYSLDRAALFLLSYCIERIS